MPEFVKDIRTTGSVPSNIEIGVRYSEEELDSIFAAGQEVLFSKTFSPKWDKLSFSEKLAQLVAIAAWLETQAVDLGLDNGEVVPK